MTRRTEAQSDSAADLITELIAQELTVATAESLTGGGLAARLVDVPGASVAYLGSVVAYQNRLKTALLGVPAELLERHGSVSAQTAAAMAQGVQRSTGACSAIATTGAAGPQAHDGRPPGTVFIAVLLDGWASVCEYRFSGDRSEVRAASVEAALALALDSIRSGRPGR
ncbi:CinA family protein [Acaricomes phytoseiuli]|uniref:CinA family protein n=1 Tax=Acaricomes phytoseiuli TaxID=291968 RepID=UPI00037AA97D|nr:CinA family protein [Acaricomes phytoseiuli]MCW1248808.1 CinA family protein [Acaricomes phytoseiuli]